MTASNDTPEATGLQPPPVQLHAVASADLGASPKQGYPPERLAVESARLYLVRVACVLLLAFFLASFAATNSDLWMHLAAGRLITQGQYPFGSDPFAYTTNGVRWVNNAWLTDLGLYGLAQALGGP